MEGFIDGQAISASGLNDIATALNVSFSKFVDGQNYAVDELNDITKAIVSKGILGTDNMCLPTLSGSTIYISTGTIVFDSGLKLKVENVMQIAVPNTRFDHYVYAKHDTLTNSVGIEIAESWGTGDIVKIAKYDSRYARIVDEREFAVAKTALPAMQFTPITGSVSESSTSFPNGYALSVNAKNARGIYISGMNGTYSGTGENSYTSVCLFNGSSKCVKIRRNVDPAEFSFGTPVIFVGNDDTKTDTNIMTIMADVSVLENGNIKFNNFRLHNSDATVGKISINFNYLIF